MKRQFVATLFASLAAAWLLPSASAQVRVSAKPVQFVGRTSLAAGGGSSASSAVGMEIRPSPEVDKQFDKQIKGAISPARVPAAHVPRPADLALSFASPATGFPGLTHADQRRAGAGAYLNTQFSTEPPDQCLAVGNGFVLEGVNSAFRVRTTLGANVTAPIPMNQFFGLAPGIIRSTLTYGPFTSDPKCHYDGPSGRWFVTIIEIDVNPATGDFLPASSVMLAVSGSNDPTGSWNVFKIDTTNYTMTSDHQGCPCFGDQPLIGADAYGFYISTNEFPIFAAGFNGAQIYALSKAALIAGTPPTAVQFSGIPLAEGPAYSVQPATTPPAEIFAASYGGTEYFLSALDFNGTLDNRIAVWALTNTSSLGSTPALTLHNAVLDSQVYGQPPDAQQKDGPLPLADFVFAGGLGIKVGKQHLPLIAGNDDRMQQTVYANGKLWSSLNTVVKPANGPTRVGAAYFVVQPSWAGGVLSGTVVNQGIVSVNGHSVLFPAVGVGTGGQAVMGFTVAGPDVFPSAAYVRLTATSSPTSVIVVAQGAVPDDGFTGYPVFTNERTGRWGDYSAAATDESGTVWFATEFIPNAPRTILANWGTFIAGIH